MECLLFSVLIIVAVVFGDQLQFKDHNGQPIDWSRATKLPNYYWNATDRNVYVYMDDKNTEWTYSTTNKSAIGPTDSNNYSTLWVTKNDSPTNINVTIILNNTEGEVVVENASPVWLVHSVPKVPQMPYQNNNSSTCPKTGKEFGQIFLCMSMMDQELDKEENIDGQSGTIIQDDNLHLPEDLLFQDNTLQPKNNDNQQPEKVRQNEFFCEPAAIKLVHNTTDLHNKSWTLSESSLVFTYWNSELGNNSIVIKINDKKEIIKHWLPGKPLKVITHGWLGLDTDDIGVFTIRKAYVRVGGYNVIAADWGRVAKNLIYPIPARLTKDVGAVIAKLLENLVNLSLIVPSDIHVIGHSLGAQVAGECGAAFSLGKIGRITGLDPAGPLFESGPWQFKHLNVTDAQFVDVIHTAGGTLGYLKSIGVVDFYPNGGISPQKGCTKPLTIITSLISSTCSHIRAIQLYEESVYNSNSFISVKCGSWLKYTTGVCKNNEKSQLGHNVDLQSRGNFYLKTNSASPYSIYV